MEKFVEAAEGPGIEKALKKLLMELMQVVLSKSHFMCALLIWVNKHSLLVADGKGVSPHRLSEIIIVGGVDNTPFFRANNLQPP